MADETAFPVGPGAYGSGSWRRGGSGRNPHANTHYLYDKDKELGHVVHGMIYHNAFAGRADRGARFIGAHDTDAAARAAVEKHTRGDDG